MNAAIAHSCVRDVVTVDRNATVADAAALMREHHVGAVVMVEDRGEARHPMGILTDRDIVVEVIAAGLDPATVKVAEIVQRPLAVVGEDADCSETARAMAINGVRRLPVVDGNGALTGLVALDDLLLHLIGPLVAVADLAGRERRFEAKVRG